MKKFSFWFQSFFILGTVLFSVSCNTIEDTASTVLSITDTATDQVESEGINYEIESSVDGYVAGITTGGANVKSAFSETTPDGVEVSVIESTLSATGFPKTITLNFGTTGIKGKRGKMLKGKIIIKLSAKLRDPQSERVITFENFMVDDNAVKGTKSVIFDGTTSWKISAHDTIVTKTGTIIGNSDRVRKLSEGAATPLTFTDDKYEITGTSDGVNKKGATYSMVIDPLKPLVLLASHPFFVSGTVTTTLGKKTILLDYGNGAVDALATITINGVSQEINLKR